MAIYNDKRVLSLRDIEDELQSTIQALNGAGDSQARLDAIHMLVNVKTARALERISNILKDTIGADLNQYTSNYNRK